jgi:hypothetical protein
MGGTCSTHEKNQKCIPNPVEKTDKKSVLKDLDVGDKIILKYVLKK